MSAGFKVVVFMLTPHFIFLCLLISHSTVLSLYHRRRKLRNSDLIPTYSQTIERENLTVDLGVNSPITVVTTPSRAYLSNAEVTGFQDAGSQEMTEDIEGRPGVE